MRLPWIKQPLAKFLIKILLYYFHHSCPQSASPYFAMSKPAKPFNPQSIQQSINKQSWLILGLVAIGIVWDVWQGNSQYAVSKNLLAGSVLGWVSQIIFAKISLSKSGYQQRRQIVHRFYQAHMAKWMLTIVGFALIFLLLKPLNAIAVFAGYLILQMSYLIITYRNPW